MGGLIENIGWHYAFYVPALLVAIFAILWLFLMFDSPAQHPRILRQETDYIEMRIIGITENHQVLI